MKTIWKKVLEVCDRQTLSLPRGAKFLHCEGQHGYPVLWFEVDPEAGLDDVHEIELFGTGQPMEDADRTYLGTALLYNGAMVLHAYERKGIAE